ncbi:MAG TPA: flagellar basal body-associated FliL family protein [Jatrophihabitans sp.]
MSPRAEKPKRIATGASSIEVSGSKSGGSPGDASGTTKKKKSMKLKIGVLVLLLLVGGAAAKFTVLAPKPAAAGTAAKKPAAGPVIPMTETTVNLAAGHFLSVQISIETTKGTSADIDTSEASDLVISQFSDRTVASLTGNAARTKAKQDLVKRLQTAYPKKILDLYYTKFVMQ